VAENRPSPVRTALRLVSASFPFGGYTAELGDSVINVAETVAEHVPPGARILDFGCGPGDKTAVLAAMGYDCTACDDLKDPWHLKGSNREAIRSYLLSQGIDFCLSASGFDLPPRVVEKCYDLILLCDVIEHLHSSPRRLLVALVGLLNDNGRLLITVPNAANLRKRLAVLMGKTNLPPFDKYYFHPNEEWRGHVREYVRADLVQLAKYAGLDILELRSCHHMLRRLPAACRLPYRWATLVCPGVRDSWLAVLQKPCGWREPEPPKFPCRSEWDPESLSGEGC
jgi:2-polyprenyl-3-methyl-5-hydroxy-6-metoxy-1,4-benzoquinol methylase